MSDEAATEARRLPAPPWPLWLVCLAAGYSFAFTYEIVRKGR